MTRRIPNTRTLVVFEAAARHGSFARAASELNLTESAVSRQIAALESDLNTELFTRAKKQVVLNNAGQAYVRNIARILSDLESETESLRAHRTGRRVLELAVIPTFASRWLLPRLQGFQSAYPGITLNLSERLQPFRFEGTPFDAALNFSHPSWTDVARTDLFEERLVPVVSPRHFNVKQLSSAEALLALPLLYKGSRPETWLHWFELARHANHGGLQLGMRVDTYWMMIDAACAGLGAGLVPRYYVTTQLQNHELVIPYDLELRGEKRYCLVYPKSKQDLPALTAFRDWLIDMRDRFVTSAY